MLILLPPSEGKAPAARRGRPVDLASLSFPGLTAARAGLIDALATTSAAPDALRLIGVGASLAGEVERNTRLRAVPARPAIEVYTGVLYAALDWSQLTGAARRRGARSLVIVSALWGAVRPGDRIPPYRVGLCSDLLGGPGAGAPTLRPERVWPSVLGAELAAAAGDRVIVDCRSEGYARLWRPAGEQAGRTAAIRVVRDGPTGRSVVSHMAKHARGEVAAFLLEHGGRAPRDVPALVEVLSDRWDVEPVAPARPGTPWRLDVVVPG